MSIGAVSNHDMAYFRAPDTRTLVTSNLGRGVASFSRIRTRAALGFTGENIVEDAIMIAYQHRPLQCDLFLESRHVPVPGRSDGTVTLYDYRRRWSCEIKTTFEATNFYLPRAILDAASGEQGASGDMTVEPGVTVDDPVVRGLAVALGRAFEQPQHPNVLFLDHIGWALASHCASSFLEAGRKPVPPGGLAPWQERLAKEMIEASLGGDLRLADLAGACRLSLPHFSRAFRETTSVPPHRWLILRRIERAQHLLLTGRRSIADIALECGFHDQSHFTHTFRRTVGVAPAAWRRCRSGEQRASP
jgi:AraC family transcriptional regulator